MKIKKVCIMLVTLASLFGFSLQAFSHHSFIGQYDPEKSTALVGTVSGVRWVNPHAFFVIDVEQEDGSTESWTFELGSPNTLVRYGWTRDTLKMGDRITADGYLARSGEKLANAKIVILADGTVFQAASSYEADAE